MSNRLSCGVIGAGFWSQYQIPGWLESNEVHIACICDPSIERAKAISKKFDIPTFYASTEEMIDAQALDFVDVITGVDTHFELAKSAARKGLNVVCQKPLTSDLKSATELVQTFDRLDQKLFVNENFRWQFPIRRLKEVSHSGRIGEIFKAHISYCSCFPVFENQPHLKNESRFIIADVGSHTLDVARFLLGEARSLSCEIYTASEGAAGEDVANILLRMESGAHCYVEMSYASIREYDYFPQTIISLEGTNGSAQLLPNYVLTITDKSGTEKEQISIPSYDWVDPAYQVVHSSIVPTQANIISGLKGGNCETDGKDNLETVRLVAASYFSAENNCKVHLKDFHG